MPFGSGTLLHLGSLDQPFTRNVKGREWGIATDLETDSPRLILAFSGRGVTVLGLPPFEFLRSLSLVQAKRAFIRDINRLWYHRGVAGVGEDIDSVAEHLRGLVAESGVQEVATIGSSAGGYGALLFGSLLSCEVHAFSPQTFIDLDLRSRHGDDRWPESIEELDGHMDPRYADLRPVIAASTSTCHVYYPAGKAVDVAHAQHIGDLPQVTLHPFESIHHNIVRELRDSGWLESFLQRLGGRAEPGPSSSLTT
jgi:hypothetical protein